MQSRSASSEEDPDHEGVRSATDKVGPGPLYNCFIYSNKLLLTYLLTYLLVGAVGWQPLSGAGYLEQVGLGQTLAGAVGWVAHSAAGSRGQVGALAGQG
ncbi:hypothetical protein E2C01_048272 [Portunus trituberculatus]|uniref:Uncharacterized protein n=1 Tax=Portunus trituberculatus TaxID=210409 RepID=A0A5B7G388_PORTR|nr:hypothetical protein [Portunus trituberculatus]